MYQERPKLNIKKSTGHVLFDWLAYGAFLFVIFHWLYHFTSLPDQIPMHYNAKGEIDRYGSKWESLLLPIVTIGLWAMCYFIEKRPHLMNMPERVNEKNVEALYRNNVYLLSVLKNIMVIIFCFLIFEVTWVALGNTQFITIWFLPLSLVSVFGPIIYYVIKQTKIR